MMFILLIRKYSRPLALTMAIAAIGIGISAVVLASMLRLSACHLCIFQRLAYFVIGLFLSVAAIGWGAFTLRQLSLTLAAAHSVWGMVVAARQSWLQWFPESGLSCSVSETGITERLIDWLGQLNPLFFMATGDCGSKDLVIAGLSLANWSFLIYLAFLAGCIASLVSAPALSVSITDVRRKLHQIDNERMADWNSNSSQDKSSGGPREEK